MMKKETYSNQKVTTSQKESTILLDTSTILLGTTHSSQGEYNMHLSQETFTKDNKLVFTEEVGDKVIQLYSYGFLVAQYDFKRNHIYLGEKWDYSKTTRKYVFLFIAGINDHYSSYLKKNIITEMLECGDDKNKVGSITGRPAPADMLGTPIYTMEFSYDKQ